MNARGRLSRSVKAKFAALVLLGLATQARAISCSSGSACRPRPADCRGLLQRASRCRRPEIHRENRGNRLWLQSLPGEFHELPTKQASDRLQAVLPVYRTLAVVGICEYGVLARPNETPFLLGYYPKAVTGNADDLNRLTPRREIPFEIQPTFENQTNRNDKSAVGRVRLVALRNGKPVPNAVFTAVDSDLSEQTIKAGADGSATWTPAGSGPLFRLCPRHAQRARCPGR